MRGKAFGFVPRDVFQAVGKVNNKSQHNGFVWDPSRFYTKAQKFHLYLKTNFLAEHA